MKKNHLKKLKLLINNSINKQLVKKLVKNFAWKTIKFWFIQNNINVLLQNIDNEEQKRINNRQKEAQMRKQKINEKIKKKKN